METRLLALMIAVLASSVSASNYFNWNADSSQTSSGSCQFDSASLDLGQKHSGASSMKLTVVGDKDSSSKASVVAGMTAGQIFLLLDQGLMVAGYTTAGG